jgi:hypothetical protein
MQFFDHPVFQVVHPVSGQKLFFGCPGVLGDPFQSLDVQNLGNQAKVKNGANFEHPVFQRVHPVSPPNMFFHLFGTISDFLGPSDGPKKHFEKNTSKFLHFLVHPVYLIFGTPCMVRDGTDGFPQVF